MILRKRPLLLALVGIGLCAGTGVPVAMREQGYWADKPLPVSRPSRFTLGEALALRPGQFRWAPYADDASSLSIVIDLSSQRAFVFQGRSLVGIAAPSRSSRKRSSTARTSIPTPRCPTCSG